MIWSSYMDNIINIEEIKKRLQSEDEVTVDFSDFCADDQAKLLEMLSYDEELSIDYSSDFSKLILSKPDYSDEERVIFDISEDLLSIAKVIKNLDDSERLFVIQEAEKHDKDKVLSTLFHALEQFMDF